MGVEIFIYFTCKNNNIFLYIYMFIIRIYETYQAVSCNEKTIDKIAK